MITVGNDSACRHQVPDQEQPSWTDLTALRLWTISGASLPGHRKPSLIREICSNSLMTVLVTVPDWIEIMASDCYEETHVSDFFWELLLFHFEGELPSNSIV